MGRKLNAIEEAQSSLLSAETDQQTSLATLQRSQQLQRRIAEQLGISAEEFCNPYNMLNENRGATNAAPPCEVLLSQECVDLIDAYIRILDPKERSRCLRIVRKAATAK